MGYNTLQNYYVTNFTLLHHHKYSLADIENLHPFERDVYIDLLMNHLRELEEAARRK